jgi:hypothetical protein
MFIIQGFQEILRTSLLAGGLSPKWSVSDHIHVVPSTPPKVSISEMM